MIVTLCLLAVINGETILRDCDGLKIYAMDRHNIWQVSRQEAIATGVNVKSPGIPIQLNDEDSVTTEPMIPMHGKRRMESRNEKR